MTFPFLQSVEKGYDYRAVHEELDRFWTQLDVPHTDLLPVFEGMPAGEVTVNRFDPHPNERANTLAAKAIESFLREQLLVAPTPPNPR